MAPELAVSHLCVVAGQAQECSPYLAAFPGKGLLRHVTFYALAEVTDTEHQELCRQAVETVQRSVQRARSSLTAAITQAAKEGRREATRDQGQAVEVGVTCVALREREVYVARTGPGLALLCDGQEVRPLFPGSETWLERFDLHEGESLLFSTSTLEDMVTREGLMAVMSPTPRGAMRRLYLLAQEEPLFCAVFIRAC